MSRRAEILHLHNQGVTQAEIARHLGISRQAVHQHIIASRSVQKAQRRLRQMRDMLSWFEEHVRELEEAAGE